MSEDAHSVSSMLTSVPLQYSLSTLFCVQVMANTKVSGARCYGYVTMATVEDAERCVEKLHKTEIHGKTVTVEKANNVSMPGI